MTHICTLPTKRKMYERILDILISKRKSIQMESKIWQQVRERERSKNVYSTYSVLYVNIQIMSRRLFTGEQSTLNTNWENIYNAYRVRVELDTFSISYEPHKNSLKKFVRMNIVADEKKISIGKIRVRRIYLCETNQKKRKKNKRTKNISKSMEKHNIKARANFSHVLCTNRKKQKL